MISGLRDLVSPDLANQDVPLILIVPIGSTEQHGPHLPLSTDTDIATAIARRVAEVQPRTVVAPAVAYGASHEHLGFAGTISIGSQVTEALLVELARSAARSFRRIVFVSAHGGNTEAVQRATDRLTQEGRPVHSWSPQWHLDAHAGRAETSVMLELRPDAVRVESASVGNTAPLQELWPALRTGGVASVSSNGVLGDPAGASAGEGRRLLAMALADLQTQLVLWEKSD